MKIEKSSFRDSSGFIFYDNGEIFRAVTYSYKDNFDFLIKSGLYDHLVEEKLMIPHQEDMKGARFGKNYYKVIKPERINFISYPFEWCFSQLKDAALVTLKIQKSALKYGMTLKDSSAYNIQFYKGKPILIDTLSFEIYNEGNPWQAYNQFCKFFIAPLALATYYDIRLCITLKDFLDGIPLDLAQKILGMKSFLNTGIFMHIYLHSKFQSRYENTDKSLSLRKKWISKKALSRMIENLEKTVNKMNIYKSESEWTDYYINEKRDESYLEEKREIVKNYIEKIKPDLVIDFGANNGEFSKIAAESCNYVLALDSDPYCIDECYINIKNNKIENLLPVVADLTNLSPSIGWANSERLALVERSKAETVNSFGKLILALAITHHLCISHNISFGMLAQLFCGIGEWLIIEFTPKSDPMVKKLLLNRKDIFENYKVEIFESEFLKFYSIIKSKKVSDTDRIIYLMKKK